MFNDKLQRMVASGGAALVLATGAPAARAFAAESNEPSATDLSAHTISTSRSSDGVETKKSATVEVFDGERSYTIEPSAQVGFLKLNGGMLTVKVPAAWKKAGEKDSFLSWSRHGGKYRIIVTTFTPPDLRDLLSNTPKDALDYARLTVLAAVESNYSKVVREENKRISYPLKGDPTRTSDKVEAVESTFFVYDEPPALSRRNSRDASGLYPYTTPPVVILPHVWVGSPQEEIPLAPREDVHPLQRGRGPLLNSSPAPRLWGKVHVTEKNGRIFMMAAFLDVSGMNELDEKGKPDLAMKVVQKGFIQETEGIFSSFSENPFGKLSVKQDAEKK